MRHEYTNYFSNQKNKITFSFLGNLFPNHKWWDW